MPRMIVVASRTRELRSHDSRRCAKNPVLLRLRTAFQYFCSSMSEYDKLIFRKGAAVNYCDTDEAKRIADLVDYIDGLETP